MKILGIDFGTVRIGLALSIEEIIIPEKFIEHTGYKKKLSALISEKNIDLIVIGIPFSMSGRYSESTFRAVSFAEKVLMFSQKPVVMVDETLSTNTARNNYQFSSEKFKKVKDSLSAMVILERYIRGEHSYHLHPDFPEFRLQGVESVKEKNVLIYEPASPYIVDVIKGLQPKTIEVFTKDPHIALKTRSKGFKPKNLVIDLELDRYDIVVLKNDAIPCSIESDSTIYYKCPWLNG